MHSLGVKVQASDPARSRAAQIKPLTAPDHTRRTGIVLYRSNPFSVKKLLNIFYSRPVCRPGSARLGDNFLVSALFRARIQPGSCWFGPGARWFDRESGAAWPSGNLAGQGGLPEGVARRRTALFSPSYLWVVGRGPGGPSFLSANRGRSAAPGQIERPPRPLACRSAMRPGTVLSAT
jgi:hypothetical protein